MAEADEVVVVCVPRDERTVQSIDVGCADCEAELAMSVVSYLELAERGTDFEPLCIDCAEVRRKDSKKVVRQMITRKTYNEVLKIQGIEPEELDQRLKDFGIEKEWEANDE